MRAGDTHERWHPGESDEYLRAAIARVNGGDMDERITDEMVERAAKALYERNLPPNEPDWGEVLHVDISIRTLYRDEARAALEAALGDVEPLEKMLGDDLYVDIAMIQKPGQCVASVTTFDHPDIPSRAGHGTGPTIDAAVRAAVANARKDGER